MFKRCSSACGRVGGMRGHDHTMRREGAMQNSDEPRNAAGERGAVARRDLLRGAAIAGLAGVLVPASAARAEVWEEGEEQCRAHVKERDLGDNIDDAMQAEFMAVSSTLTGVALSSEADRRLGRQYLER